MDGNVTSPMDLRSRLLEYTRKGDRGLEIGPWFRPYAPKREGFNTLVVDTMPRDALVAKALNDPNVPRELTAQIEDVDIIATTDLAAAVGRVDPAARFDYILASHVIEHLPDPLRFLRDCETLLTPTGVLSLAVPDKRVCFDHFAPLTSIGEVIDAFDEHRTRPTPGQVLSFAASHARLGDGRIAFDLGADPATIHVDEQLDDAGALYDRTRTTELYEDIHCWRFVLDSFLLLIEDLQRLGLTRLHIRHAFPTPTDGLEFVVHLSLAAPADSVTPGRTARLAAVRRDLATYTPEFQLAATFEEFRGRADRAEAEIARLRSQVAHLTSEVHALTTARDHYAALLDKITHSRAWRLTAPARALVSWLRAS